MTNRDRTYGMAPEWRIIANSIIEPRMGTGRPILNCDLRKPVKLTYNALSADLIATRVGSPVLGDDYRSNAVGNRRPSFERVQTEFRSAEMLLWNRKWSCAARLSIDS